MRKLRVASCISAICLLAMITICACVAEDASTAYDRMGGKLYSKGNYTEALNYFNLSLDQNSSNVDAWIHKGDTLRVLRKLNASIDAYDRALKYDRKKTAVWSGLADAYAARKDYENASDAAAKATETDSKNKANWLREGNLLQMRGLFIKAIAKFDGALKLDAKYRDALYREALSQIASDNITVGEALLDQVLSIDPKYKYAYNARGEAQEAESRYADALASYNKALELDPKWSLALNNKMHVMMALNKTRDAMNIFIRI